ncbi:MAG: DMT family transporter [Candidatus Acidiferrum sp.]
MTIQANLPPIGGSRTGRVDLTITNVASPSNSSFVETRPSAAKADLALVLCTLLWGATFVVVKNALAHASVFIFFALRFTFAAALMTVFRPHVLRNLKKEELLAGAALGFFMFGGYAFQTAGLLYTTPAKSGFVTGSSVVLVPLLLAIFWRKHLAR